MTRRHENPQNTSPALDAEKDPAPGIRLEETLAAARGNEADGAWLRPAIWEWIKVGARHWAMQEAVDEAAALVAEADESPEEIFGNARIWAQERAIEWERDGVPAFDTSSSFDGRDAVVWGLGLGTCLAVLFFLSAVLTGRWTEGFTPGLVAAPALLGIGCLATGTVWKSVLRRRGFWAAVLVSSLVLVLLVATMVTAFAETDPWRVVASALWWLPVVAAYAGLTWVVSRLWPAAPETGAEPPAGHGGTEVMADDAWLAAARTGLQERNEITGRRIEEVLAEVRSHARETGRTLHEEFGDPWGYAVSVPSQAGVRERRWFWLSAAILVLVLIDLVSHLVGAGGWTGPGIWIVVVWFMVAAAGTVVRWRAWRAAVRSARGATTA